MPRNPDCFPTDSTTITAAVEQLPDDSGLWRSQCNCLDQDGRPTVTCESGTQDEAYRALLEHRGEPTEAPA
ncbi:hypothetical protein VA596_41565 [Amycolatopsis sp., V23-08]|uniref:Uncharacterized protein n=1 Tax=Amycolatopsis heterodermiae TaxID=3110235 RepID=A0ABU5RIF9_9PSEU|nr:hypothetical protein [Amycolatopsis sp., V23-08]MEA5366075.1 hypothetical protein [Amycolatopsis sp., V23-08]